MHSIRSRLIVVALAVAAVFTASTADARHRKTTHQATSTSLPVDSSGTPIIMKGYEAEKGRAGSRVSAPVVVPPPSTGLRDLPAKQLLQGAPPPPVVARPAQPSFSDRVTNCIHSYPLNAGIGNNPTGMNAYVGQCANQ